MQRNDTRWDWLWLASCMLASSAWCVTAAAQLSATFDEPTYVSLGLERWRSGSYHRLMRLGTMPLPVDAQTLPLYLWERWRGTEFDVQQDFAALLPWARAMTLPFWWLLLLYGMRLGRELAGPWGGRLAAAMLACEPGLIAHAALATTDVAVSAFLLAFVFHFRRGRQGNCWRRRLIPALWLTLAILAKASGLVFGGLCMLTIEVDRLFRTGAWHCTATGLAARLVHCCRQLRPFLADSCWIVGGGLAGVLIYCGSDWQVEPSFIRWAQTLPEGPFARALLWLAEHLRIFSNGGEGLVQQFKHNVRGHGTFLLGQVHPRALWYYFPVLLTIKLTLSLLAAPLLVGLVRPRALANWVLVMAGCLVLLSPAFRVQIGLRLILPVVALLVVGLAAALATACQQAAAGWRRRLLTGAATLAVLWPALALWNVWPHALCYVNELYGGTAQGYRLVCDANYDWGQGLVELARWRQAHGIELDVWYYGADPRLKQWALRPLPLHAMPFDDPDDVRQALDRRWLAVSTTVLYYANPKERNRAHQAAMEFLRAQQPVARTTTFLIFDFTGKSPRGH